MFTYIRQIVSEASSASFARWSTACTVATGCFSVIHVVLKTHALPDGGSLAGLGAFMSAPYAISKVTAALRADPDHHDDDHKPEPGQIDHLSAAADPTAPTATLRGWSLGRFRIIGFIKRV